MTRIFLSYRRDDSAYVANQLRDEFTDFFGAGSVFFDVDSIPVGTDFRQYIHDEVAQCDALIVLIGNRWLDARSDGRRRLDDPNDYVRIEIESALQRDIPVIPVLLENMEMPREQELPSSISALSYRNAAVIRADRDFNQHIKRLVQDIHKLITENRRIDTPQSPLKPRLMTNKGTYALITLATLFNIVPFTALKLNIYDELLVPFMYDGSLVPLIIILCIGYTNGKKIGVMAGLIAYFPNFVVHIVCFLLQIPYFKGNAFSGTLNLSSVFGTNSSITFSTVFIDYFIFSSFGYMSAILREKLTLLEIKKTYISSVKKPASQAIYLLLIPALLSALNIDFGLIRLNMQSIYHVMPLIISFYYGASKALYLLIFMIPAFIFKIRIGPVDAKLMLGFGETLVFMMLIFLAGHLCVEKKGIHHRDADLVMTLLFITLCWLFNFEYTATPKLQYSAVGFGLITVLLSGFILGSYYGFWIGILWGMLSIIQIFPMRGLAISGPSLYITCAPIVGYFGGTDLFDKPYFFRHGVFLFLIFYSAMLLDHIIWGISGIMYGITKMGLAFLQNVIALFIVRHTILHVAKRPQVGASHAATS